MSNPNKLPLEQLQARVEKLKAELADVAHKIEKLEEDRDKDLEAYAGKVKAAKADAHNAAQLRDEAAEDAAAVEAKGNALIAAGKKLLKEAEAAKLEVEHWDLRLQPVRLAEAELKAREKHWSEELGRIQDGRTRRRRAQLQKDIAKLEKRMARKAEEPELGGDVKAPFVNGGLPIKEPAEEGGEGQDANS